MKGENKNKEWKSGDRIFCKPNYLKAENSLSCVKVEKILRKIFDFYILH